MNTKMSKLALAIGALAMAGGVMAADATNATATATATVLKPLKIAKTTDLVFGSVVGGNGVVTVATNGDRSKLGGAAFVGTSAPTAAEFTVTGEGTSSFSIDYTGSTAVLTNQTGTGVETMAIGWITEAVAATATGLTTVGQPATGTLTEGSAKIFSGATLAVADFQVAGTYTGALKVTVAYN